MPTKAIASIDVTRSNISASETVNLKPRQKKYKDRENNLSPTSASLNASRDLLDVPDKSDRDHLHRQTKANPDENAKTGSSNFSNGVCI